MTGSKGEKADEYRSHNVYDCGKDQRIHIQKENILRAQGSKMGSRIHRLTKGICQGKQLKHLLWK